MKIGTGIPGQDSPATSWRSAGKFQLPRGALQWVLSPFMVGAVAPSSVVAVSRANRSFVVFGEGISQLASLAW
jgi:hypothetical protein